MIHSMIQLRTRPSIHDLFGGAFHIQTATIILHGGVICELWILISLLAFIYCLKFKNNNENFLLSSRQGKWDPTKWPPVPTTGQLWQSDHSECCQCPLGAKVALVEKHCSRCGRFWLPRHGCSQGSLSTWELWSSWKQFDSKLGGIHIHPSNFSVSFCSVFGWGLSHREIEVNFIRKRRRSPIGGGVW